MGTIGGSLANNDPAADYPAVAMALNATIKTDKRTIAAEDFFTGLFSTALEPGELIVSVSFPVPAKAGYAKFDNPASRYAMAGVFVARLKDGAIRVGVTGAHGEGVFRSNALEQALTGSWSADAVAGRRHRCRRHALRHPRLGSLSRQPRQGDGQAGARRGGLARAARRIAPRHS